MGDVHGGVGKDIKKTLSRGEGCSTEDVSGEGRSLEEPTSSGKTRGRITYQCAEKEHRALWEFTTKPRIKSRSGKRSREIRERKERRGENASRRA